MWLKKGENGRENTDEFSGIKRHFAVPEERLRDFAVNGQVG
jgi:hypothetical protein